MSAETAFDRTSNLSTTNTKFQETLNALYACGLTSRPPFFFHATFSLSLSLSQVFIFLGFLIAEPFKDRLQRVDKRRVTRCRYGTEESAEHNEYGRNTFITCGGAFIRCCMENEEGPPTLFFAAIKRIFGSSGGDDRRYITTFLARCRSLPRRTGAWRIGRRLIYADGLYAITIYAR